MINETEIVTMLVRYSTVLRRLNLLRDVYEFCH